MRFKFCVKTLSASQGTAAFDERHGLFHLVAKLVKIGFQHPKKFLSIPPENLLQIIRDVGGV
jgi:hypothetical protein